MTILFCWCQIFMQAMQSTLVAANDFIYKKLDGVDE